MPAIASPRRLLPSLLVGMLVACAETSPDAERVELLFTFEEGTQGWGGNVTDFSPEQEDLIDFTFDRRPLPPEVTGTGQALFLSGTNVSDNLFMYLIHPVGELEPDTSYALTFELTLASNAPSGCVGIGGPPGESVYLKAGAARVQPERVMDAQGRWRINVDKGNQSQGGANAQVIGNIANGLQDCHSTPYRIITRDNHGNPFRITTSDQGQLWLLLGTDSGFEGTTALYYDTIRVVFEPTQD